jgi:hypothetical protein
MAFSLGLHGRIHRREAADELCALVLPQSPMITENAAHDYWG